MVQEINLNEKIWFRTLKVLYIGLFLIVLLVIGFWASTAIPHEDRSLGKIQEIVCNDGKKYHPKTDIFIQYDGSLYDADDTEARKLCQYGVNDYAKDLAVPNVKNYTVNITYSTVGSWQSVLMILLIGFGISFLLFESIKRIFLYIAIGKKIF